jgi:exopolysaccharide biosynthesis protein
MTRNFLISIFLCQISVCLFTQLKDQSIDSNTNKTKENKEKQREYITPSKKDAPKILLKNVDGKTSNILLFEPFRLNIVLRSNRPKFEQDNFFCIPAAFTTKTNKVDGLFIENGKKINSIINKGLNGFCLLTKDTLEINSLENLDQKILTLAKKDGSSLFQQFLLIKQSKIIDCNAFRERKNLRRALIQFNNLVCVGQSQRPVTIREFQELLIKIGAVNAIYLDMGTWSEGWYKNENYKKIIIGENMINTDEQTNWLIYKKE